MTGEDSIQRGTMEPRDHQQHCYVINESDVVTLYPVSDHVTIDGLLITTPTRLFQGKSIICLR